MFIGEKLIKEDVKKDGRVEVTFEDDSRANFTKKMFDASFTLEPINASKLQERRILAVQAEFMQLLLDWEVKLSDLPPLLQWSANYIDQKHEFASEKLWGNKYNERTFGDLERILSEKSNTGS